MKIQVLSDIHFDVDEVRDDLRLNPEADCVVVAGDVCEGIENSLGWLRERFGQDVPIITVAGNHTFYRRSLQEELAAASDLAKSYRIDFLENGAVEHGDVRFLGCSLWTDYCLQGEPFRLYAMREARDKMNDHKKISLQKKPWKRFLPEDAARLHRRSVEYLRSSISNSGAKRTFVVTHHAPSIKSLPFLYRDALLSAAYASHLDSLVSELEGVWLHGHTHNSSDYMIGNCRVICNPHGYGRENLQFDPSLIVEL
jgi:predicted phosphodiesterase